MVTMILGRLFLFPSSLRHQDDRRRGKAANQVALCPPTLLTILTHSKLKLKHLQNHVNQSRPQHHHRRHHRRPYRGNNRQFGYQLSVRSDPGSDSRVWAAVSLETTNIPSSLSSRIFEK
mmetsp:Transcript_26788/g.48297  ORF Transcript_26788/g.48297 Transcript_26788/m.48297 type:complete len:119 (-) Transcript_26788:78-434(-)